MKFLLFLPWGSGNPPKISHFLWSFLFCWSSFHWFETDFSCQIKKSSFSSQKLHTFRWKIFACGAGQFEHTKKPLFSWNYHPNLTILRHFHTCSKSPKNFTKLKTSSWNPPPERTLFKLRQISDAKHPFSEFFRGGCQNTIFKENLPNFLNFRTFTPR